MFINDISPEQAAELLRQAGSGRRVNDRVERVAAAFRERAGRDPDGVLGGPGGGST